MDQMKLDCQTCPSVFRSTFLSSHSRNGAIKEPSLSSPLSSIHYSDRAGKELPLLLFPSSHPSCVLSVPSPPPSKCSKVRGWKSLHFPSSVSCSEWEVASILNFLLCCVSEAVLMWCTTVSDPGSAEIRFQLHSPCGSHLLRTEVALQWGDESNISYTYQILYDLILFSLLWGNLLGGLKK